VSEKSFLAAFKRLSARFGRLLAQPLTAGVLPGGQLQGVLTSFNFKWLKPPVGKDVKTPCF